MGNSGTKETKDHLSSRYKWEIQSFSLLKNTQKENYESACFQVGGHDWRLVLYPSGNKGSGGKDHISLYLKICESDHISNGGSVAVKFKLFLFDHKKKKYLIRNMSHSSDADGGMQRFDKNRNMQGFDQLISLEDFQKKPSRYLRDNRCTFGADVFVIPTVREESLSIVKNPKAESLEFRKFSTINDQKCSNKFTVDGKEWQILVCPKANGEQKDKSLSVYLVLCDNNYEKFYAEFKLKALGKSFNHEKPGRGWSSQKRVGFDDFMSLKKLRQDGFIDKDTLTVEVEILQVSVVKNP